MGQSARRKAKFREQHPVCCFCGGLRPTESRDHQPGRAFFNNRHSPDDYVFPACHRCNAASQDSEEILRVIAVPNTIDDSENDRRRWRSVVSSVRRKHPHLIDSMFMNTREKRNKLRQLGIAPLPGDTITDVPVVKLDPAMWKPHIEMVGQKLLLALHYQCFGKPVPLEGGLSLLFQTNTKLGEGSLTHKFSELTDLLAVPAHQNQRLGDQFSIRWSHRTDPDIALWAVHLHMRIFFLGITSSDENLAKLEHAKFFRPLFADFDR